MMRDQYQVQHDLEDVDFYWGVASGGTHAALSRAHDFADLPDPEHQMVSFATQKNGVWEGPDWFIDSGGAPDSIRANGGHERPVSDYLDYLREPPTKYGCDADDVSIERFALRDWPVEPQVRDALGLSVEDLQERTLKDHIRMMDAVESDSRIDAQPVAVLQGWEPDDYLRCLDLFRDHGLVTDVVGLGSVCRRGGLDDIQDVAHRVRRNLPARVDLHGFGLKQTMLDKPRSLAVFDSVDSAAWEYSLRQATKDGFETPPPLDGLDYEDWDDWDDRGNPRYTWGNLHKAYLGYRENVHAFKRSGQTDWSDWGRDVQVTSLADWPQVVDDLAARGEDTDGYALLQCVCGTVVDPGRPDASPDPGCRHCQRSGINIWDRHRAERDETLRTETDERVPAVAD